MCFHIHSPACVKEDSLQCPLCLWPSLLRGTWAELPGPRSHTQSFRPNSTPGWLCPKGQTASAMSALNPQVLGHRRLRYFLLAGEFVLGTCITQNPSRREMYPQSIPWRQFNDGIFTEVVRVKGNKRRGQNTHGWSTVQVHHHFSQKKGGEVVPRSYWKRTPPQPKPWLQTANQSAAWWEKNKILTLCPLVSCPSSQKQQKQKDRELWVTGFTYISETEQMKTNQYWDFSGGPEVKTLSFQCSGFGFEPWFGN